MMENQNTFDMTENIPDEMFEIIGLEKDEEVPARPRIGYWADAWRRFKEDLKPLYNRYSGYEL